MEAWLVTEADAAKAVATVEKSTRFVETGTTMNIFGDLDITGVSDDPFGIEPATYWAVVIDAGIKEDQNEPGVFSFFIKWQIDEPANEYDKSKITEYYPVFVGKKFADLDPEQKRRIKFLKARMRRAFDFSEQEAQGAAPSTLIGKGAYITTVNNEGKEGTANAGKKFANIRDAISKRLFEEEGGTASNSDATAMAKDLGL